MTKKPYWLESKYAAQITALIERAPIMYGCTLAHLEFMVQISEEKSHV